MNLQTTLKKHGLKATPKRVAVLSIFEQNQNPLSIEDITNFLKKRKIRVDQVTVYRIIDAFLKLQLISRFDFHEGKFRYEIASKPHHHHAVCTECGYVEDINEHIFGNVVDKVSKETDFHITNHAIEFFGLCHNCK